MAEFGRSIVASVVLAIALGSSLYAGGPPQHVALAKDGKYYPEPGYAWIDAASGDLRVKWSPGVEHSGHRHVIAAKEEGQWVPAPGYSWKDSPPRFPNVVWTQGLAYPGAPGMVSTATEGNWLPAPGYRWKDSPPRFGRVEWEPGQRSGDIVAGANAGDWRPAPGFAWVNPQSRNDLRVARVSAYSNPSGFVPPTDVEVGRCIVKVIGAALAHGLTESQESDGILETIARKVAEEARNNLIQSAVDDLFGRSLKPVERRAVSRMIVLGVEGRFNDDAWRESTIRDELIAAFQENGNSDAAAATAAADFISRVRESYSRRKR